MVNQPEGMVHRWDGAAMKKLSLGLKLPQMLTGVWVAGPKQPYVSGWGGTVVRMLSGGAWQAMKTGTTANLQGIWGGSAKDLWVVGEKGVILHYDGKTFRPACFKVPGNADLHAVWGDGKGKVYVGGTGGTLNQF